MSEVIINQSNSLITFDTQLKTALFVHKSFAAQRSVPGSGRVIGKGYLEQ